VKKMEQIIWLNIGVFLGFLGLFYLVLFKGNQGKKRYSNYFKKIKYRRNKK